MARRCTSDPRRARPLLAGAYCAALLAGCLGGEIVAGDHRGRDGGPAGAADGGAGQDAGPATAACANGVRDVGEADVDCGGVCPARCLVGQVCGIQADCDSGLCAGGVCVAPSCSDGLRDGTETDVDCGGGACPGCALGGACSGGTDCLSGVCVSGACGAAACLNTTTLTWTEATQNEDGTCLTDLGGYKVYYGQTSGALTTIIDLPVGSPLMTCAPTGNTTPCGPESACTHVISDLQAGTWYFAMTTYNTAGEESVTTGEVTKVVTCD